LQDYLWGSFVIMLGYAVLMTGDVVLVKHGDKDYVAGSGMYDVTAAQIKAKFPNDAIYTDE